METEAFVSHQNYSILITRITDTELTLHLEEESEDEFDDIEKEKVIDDPDADRLPSTRQQRDQKKRTDPDSIIARPLLIVALSASVDASVPLWRPGIIFRSSSQNTRSTENTVHKPNLTLAPDRSWHWGGLALHHSPRA
jgi:hypothetical protein